MITNETRAKLVGWHKYNYSTFWCPPEGGKCIDETEIPSYDTDANAVAELIDYLWHHQGHSAVGRFLHELTKDLGCPRDDAFTMLRATPAQLTKAFDATFADELSRIE